MKDEGNGLKPQCPGLYDSDYFAGPHHTTMGY